MHFWIILLKCQFKGPPALVYLNALLHMRNQGKLCTPLFIYFIQIVHIEICSQNKSALKIKSIIFMKTLQIVTLRIKTKNELMELSIKKN